MSKSTNNESSSLNPFEAAMQQTNTSDSKQTRQLDYTPALISCADQRAIALIQGVAGNPQFIELANKMLKTGDTDVVKELVESYYGETINADAVTVLAGCDEAQLKRLLESRRSDRSKAKKAGLNRNFKTFISAMYAELMIRIQLGKPLNQKSGGADLDESDLDAVNKKIRALQSKQTRVGKLAELGDKQAAKDLADVKSEIARLQSLRPTQRINVKTVIKDMDLNQLREMLALVDVENLPADQLIAYEDLKRKIG